MTDIAAAVFLAFVVLTFLVGPRIVRECEDARDKVLTTAPCSSFRNTETQHVPLRCLDWRPGRDEPGDAGVRP